jgi:hypothetical protein
MSVPQHSKNYISYYWTLSRQQYSDYCYTRLSKHVQEDGICYISDQDRHHTHNVTLRRFRKPLLKRKNKKHYILWKYVCSLGHSACKAYVPYCIVICDLPGCTQFFPHYLIKGTILGKTSLITKCVLWFSLQFCLTHFEKVTDHQMRVRFFFTVLSNTFRKSYWSENACYDFLYSFVWHISKKLMIIKCVLWFSLVLSDTFRKSNWS